MKSRFLVIALCFAISLLLVAVESKPVQANDIYACTNGNVEFYVMEETIMTGAPGKIICQFSCQTKMVKNGKTYRTPLWCYRQKNGEWFYNTYYDGVSKVGERPLSTNWVAESIFNVLIRYI